MRKTSLMMGVLAAVIAGAAFIYVDSRDAVAEKQAAIEEAWDQATAVIAARSELVPPLADAFQRRGRLESRLLMNVVEARAALENSPERPEKIAASINLTAALAELLAAAERDPALRSDPTVRCTSATTVASSAPPSSATCSSPAASTRRRTSADASSAST